MQGFGVLVATLGLFLQIGPPMPAPVPPPEVTVRNEITLTAPDPDPEKTATMGSWAISGFVVNVVAPTAVDWTNALLDVPDFVRTTPPDMSYGNQVVQAMADLVRKVALALMALTIAAWAYQAMVTHSGEGAGTVIYGTALMLGNMVWWRWGIDLNNAINNAVAAPELGSIVRPHLTLPYQGVEGDPTKAFAPAIVVFATFIVTLLLVVSMFARLAFLDFLICAGALALFCKTNDNASHIANTYTGMAVGTLFSQVAVVIMLKLSSAHGFAVGGIAGTILTLSMVLLARSMPGLLSSRFSQSGGGIGLRTLILLRRLVIRR
jgi:hypothetical protein